MPPLSLVLALGLSLSFEPTASTPEDTRGVHALAPALSFQHLTAPKTAAKASDGVPLVHEFRLDNGLTVLLSELHDRAEVFGAVVVNAGSKDDPADDTGLAHYLEHMLFKGTQELGTTDYAREAPLLAAIERLYDRLRTAGPDERKRIHAEIDALAKQAAAYAVPNELDRLLAEQGGHEINAFTHPDMTVYYNAFPASQVERWLELYAHRFEQPVFRLFPSELEAVYEEKNRSMDGFFNAAYEGFLRNFFPHHPYGTQPALGTVEHLKRPSPRAMRAFYERYYVANNMALVLVGDIDAAALEPVIRERFSSWQSGPTPPKTLGAVRPFAPHERHTIRVTPLRAGAIAFRTPVLQDPDYAATKVLLRLLSNEQRSGALDRLVDRGALLLAILFELDFHDANGAILAFAPRVITQTFAGAEKGILRELDRLGRRDLPRPRVIAVRENLLREAALAWEDTEDRALLLADVFARGLSWNDYVRYVDTLRKVEPTDVRRAAARYFGDRHLVVRGRIGRPDRARLEKPSYGAVVPDEERVSAYARRAAQGEVKAPAPHFVDFDRDITRVAVRPGVELHANANAENEISRLELRFGIGHGERPELALLGDYLVRAGTRSRPGQAFHARWFELATTFTAYAERERFVLAIEGPEAHLREALALVAEAMREPAKDGKRLKKIKRERWFTELGLRREPSLLREALWEHVVYGERSDVRRLGARALRGHSAEDLLEAWDAVQRRAITVRYVGTREASTIAKELRAALPWRDGLEPAAPKLVRETLSPTRSRVVFVPRRDSVQTQLSFYVKGDRVGAEAWPRMDAFAEYFGGNMAGLVFQEVREYRALAYSAHGGFATPQRPDVPGFTYVHIGCQADKTGEALAVVHRLLTALPQKPGRIGSVQSSLAHRLESEDPGFRDLQEQVQAWRWQGFEADPRKQWLAGYEAIRFEDIERFWREQVAGRPIVLMVIGDPRRIDRALLERFGEVEVVHVGRLYRP